MEKNDYLYIDSSDSNDDTRQSRFIIPKTNKIDYLISKTKYAEALSLIEKTLKKDDADYWLLKAEVYDNQKEYEKSIDSINHALSLDESDHIKIHKANTLYNWAKVSYFPELEYEKALGLIDEALDLLSRARVRLADEIKWNPLWWGNIELMEETVTLQYELGGRPSVLDIYDLFSLALEKCCLCFSYEGKPYFVEVVAEEDGTSLFFEGKWFRSPRDFFSKAQINGLKITYVYDKLDGFLVQ